MAARVEAKVNKQASATYFAHGKPAYPAQTAAKPPAPSCLVIFTASGRYTRKKGFKPASSISVVKVEVSMLPGGVAAGRAGGRG